AVLATCKPMFGFITRQRKTLIKEITMFKLFATDTWFKKAAKEEEGHDPSAGPEILPVAAEPSEDGGSTYKVPLTTILELNPHNNAERLELATVYGFQVIVRKGQYKVGDKVIYIPI